MVTFAQAQERADEWVNGDVPAYQHREVRVREFELGFVVWAEDRANGPVSDGGRQRLVIARDSGEATLWPGLPVGEVIRRYEEEYGAAEVGQAAPEPPQRIDLNQTSFLLSPPEWLQEAADKLGIPDRRAEGAGDQVPPQASPPAVPAAPPVPAAPAPIPSPASPPESPYSSAPSAPASASDGRGAYEPTAYEGVQASSPQPPVGATPWAGTDTNAGSDEGAVGLPATVFAPPLSGADDDEEPPRVVSAEAPTALMSGGSQLPRTAIVPGLDSQSPGPQGPGAPGAPAAPGVPSAPGVPGAPGAADISQEATSKAAVSPRGARGGVRRLRRRRAPPVFRVRCRVRRCRRPPDRVRPAPRRAGTCRRSSPRSRPRPVRRSLPARPVRPVRRRRPAVTCIRRPRCSRPPPRWVRPVPRSRPARPAGPVFRVFRSLPVRPVSRVSPVLPLLPVRLVRRRRPVSVCIMRRRCSRPPARWVRPVLRSLPVRPVRPVDRWGCPRTAAAARSHLPPAAYGYPQAPPGQPIVGPGYQAVLRYRGPDGSEQQLIRRSAPGTPHPEWQMLHELRAMNVPPQQVIELHTELESCELPGGYCARMIRETWPQVRITSVAPYGTDHASRQQGMQHLLTHQGELHQVADGPARPAPVRAPLPQLPPAMPVPPEAVAEELLQTFGPQGVLRFDQRAVSRQGVPEIVARTLVWAGLPADFGPFFWAQPGQPVVPTLAELAAQRQVQPAPDAGSYLVMGSDFGRAICVQYGTANIVAVPVEAGPGGQSVAPQFVNTGLPEFTRSLALLGRMWRLRFGLNPEQAGRWTVDFQAQLVALDPAALASPESWWSVLLEQMWDGLI